MKNGFTEFNLQPFLITALKEINFIQPTGIYVSLYIINV